MIDINLETIGLTITGHAYTRSQQRGISEETISDVVRHGIKKRGERGLYIRMLSRSKSRVLRHAGGLSPSSIEKAMGIVVVTAEYEDEIRVITVLPRRKGRLAVRVA